MQSLKTAMPFPCKELLALLVCGAMASNNISFAMPVHRGRSARVSRLRRVLPTIPRFTGYRRFKGQYMVLVRGDGQPPAIGAVGDGPLGGSSFLVSTERHSVLAASQIRTVPSWETEASLDPSRWKAT